MGAIDVVETAYMPTHDTREWVALLLDKAGPLLDRGHGSFALMVESMSPERVALGDFVLKDCNDVVREFVEQVTGGLSAQDFQRTYGSPAIFDSMSGRAAGSYTPDHWMFKAFREQLGVPDFDLLRAVDPSGFGCLMAAGRNELNAPSKREKARWSRIAAHIVAGLRVHRAMRSEPQGISQLERDPVEAVLDPGGRVVHACGVAKAVGARAELRSATRAMDRARASLRVRDPEEALRAWNALVAGRWSLVDIFDSDGRRFIVARENQPATPPLMKLTRREQDVVAYARLGWSNKLVAYTLGLAESTISEALRRALDKMGLRSRVELVRAGPGGASA